MNTHLDCPSPACDLLLSDRAICYGGSTGFINLSAHQIECSSRMRIAIALAAGWSFFFWCGLSRCKPSAGGLDPQRLYLAVRRAI